MNVVERYRTVLVVAVVRDLLAARISGVPAVAEALVLPSLMVMLLSAFAGIQLW